MIYAATGHRPDKLDGHSKSAEELLYAFALNTLGNLPEYPEGLARGLKVITGMAVGWDQAVADACVTLSIPFIAAIPFPNQDALWPYPARRRYLDLLRHSAESFIISQGLYSAHKMDLRNRWMVDRCDKLIALWDGVVGGGTWNCIKYAESKQVEVIHLWGKWQEYKNTTAA